MRNQRLGLIAKSCMKSCMCLRCRQVGKAQGRTDKEKGEQDMSAKKNKVNFNICNVHYALITVADDGEVNFGMPVAMPGAVSLSLELNGERQREDGELCPAF